MQRACATASALLPRASALRIPLARPLRCPPWTELPQAQRAAGGPVIWNWLQEKVHRSLWGAEEAWLTPIVSRPEGCMDACKDWTRECGPEDQPTPAWLLLTTTSMSESIYPLRLYPILYLPSRLDEPKFLKAVLKLDFCEAEDAASALELFGKIDLAERMRHSMGNSDVNRFAWKLRRAAIKLAVKYPGYLPLPDSDRDVPKYREDWVVSFTTCGEAIECIRDAADWYEQVGAVDCSVEAA